VTEVTPQALKTLRLRLFELNTVLQSPRYKREALLGIDKVDAPEENEINIIFFGLQIFLFA